MKILIKEDGTIYLGNDQIDVCALLIGLIDEIKGLETFGAPGMHRVTLPAQQKLDAYKNKVKNLFAEAE
ncbi:MAG: hypothetical protein LBH85_02765 [Treponema sp.]|jgi:hypothetical protein|nr:hypothetical protein [Treponema sp.]